MRKGLVPFIVPIICSAAATATAILSEKLMPHGSALLIDPDYKFSTAESVIPSNKGMLITLEDFQFEETPDGRKSRLMSGWDVGKVKRMGADGVKLLLWYRPDASKDVITHQRDLVRQVGRDCARFDIPLLLELLVYPFKGSEGHTTDYAEDARKHPDLVPQSLRDFADPEYGVDIFKIESPIVANRLPDPDSDSQATRDAQAQFNAIGDIISRPWVMLSAGAGMDVFRRVLGFAYRAGANGYLAGRAIWWQAFGAFPDEYAMRIALEGNASTYMLEINRLTDEQARPWTQARAFDGRVELAYAGHAFPSENPAI